MTSGNFGKQQWYYLIDGIRGIALISMLLFHFSYDINIIFERDPQWYAYPSVRIWQQSICVSFLFISGMCWHFGHHHLKRGIQLNLYGLGISLITLLALPSQAVRFGILNLIGCSTLLLIPIDCLLTSRIRKGSFHTGFSLAGLVISLFSFAATHDAAHGSLGIGAFHLVLPNYMYQHRALAFLGFPDPAFSSSDYFPILPWFFLFFAGYWFWELICHCKMLLTFLQRPLPMFSCVGRNTIWIYLIHQPILYSIAYLLVNVA